MAAAQGIAMPDLPPIQPPPEEEEEEGIYEVDQIIDQERRKGKDWFKCTWKGYEDQTWEPLTNLNKAMDKVEDYQRTHTMRTTRVSQ